MLLLPGGKALAGTGYWDNARSGVAAYLLQVAPTGNVLWELNEGDQMGRVLDLQETEDHGDLAVCKATNQDSKGLLVKLSPH
jgi:hypothetical protein